MATVETIYQIADELSALASLGLHFAENGYDRERYDQVLRASARLAAALEEAALEEAALEEAALEEAALKRAAPDEADAFDQVGQAAAIYDIYTQYSANLKHVSPILAVEAAVFCGDQILLIQRADNHLWAIPGGLSEVGETPAQAAERELWEEAGVRGKAIRLLGLFDSRLWHSGAKMQIVSALFLLEADGRPSLHPNGGDETTSPLAETLDLGFFDEQSLPPLSPGHALRVPLAFRLSRGEVASPFFDA